ncbi:MAG: PAS domain-containing sensor histidine kinase [Acidimicrobiales bacterium]|nr:PAS domain-containing sensor histidine kinase [Acidimicrobiales bacterium]
MGQLKQSERIVLGLVAVAVLAGGVAPTVNDQALASAIMYDFAALAAAVCALFGALRLPRERRGEWYLVATGCFCFFAGDVVWDIYERVLHEPAPLPSLADAIYLLAYPILALAVLHMVRRRTDADRLTAWLDVGVLAMSVGLLVCEPLLVDSGRSFLGALIAGAYPVADIVLLGFAVALIGQGRAPQSTLFLVGGAGTLFIADLSYLILENRGTYATGGWPDPLFVIGTFLLAVAPWFEDATEVEDSTQRKHARDVPGTVIVVAALVALPIDFGLVAGENESVDDKVVRMLLRILLLSFVAVRLIRQAARNEALVVSLDRTSTRLTTVIENTADAVVFVGPTGEILEWNATAETLFGFPRDEVLGTSVFALFDRAENVQVAQSVMDSLSTGGSLEITLDLAPQGHAMAVALQISAVTDSNGAVVGFVTVARDTTRQVLANHAMQSFAHLHPAEALAEFANDLKLYVSFDTLSLANIEGDRFTELARIAAVGEGRDRALTAAPDDELIHGPLLGIIDALDDEPFVILERGQYDRYSGDMDAAGVTETIALPLRDPLTGELRGLLGMGFATAGAATRDVANSLARVAPELSRSVMNMALYARERQTSARLQELDDLREGFFALVAHEVRSPLGAIGTAASVLRDHGSTMDSGAAHDLAAGIAESARRLARLTGDLVDVGRGDHGTFPCEIRPIEDLGEIVAAAATSGAGPNADRLRVCVASGVAVNGDPDRLSQVVVNLVTNSLKFSTGEVELRLAAMDGQAVVHVVDHGPGIPAAQTHRLFQRFTRLPFEGVGPRPSGSGLGLYITRELVLAHDGSLAHEPTPGGGATFVLRLPLAGAITSGADA